MNTQTLAPPAGTKSLRLDLLGDDIAAWDRPGTEPAFLFIHGNTASKEAFRPLFEAAAIARHRLVAIDLPGCGESADARDPRERYTLPGLAAAVIASASALELGRYVLVGWSLGGHVAIQTILHDVTADGMVLTGTPPCGPDPVEMAQTFLPIPGAEVMSSEHPTAEQVDAFLASVYAPLPPADALRRAALRSDGRLRKRMFEHVFATPDLEPQRRTVARWPRPIALIQGRQECVFRPEMLDDLAWGHLWRGATRWIDDTGHAPFISHPEAYAKILAEFAADLPIAIR